MNVFHFPAFFRKVDSGGYPVEFPDLPGCVSTGDTLEEALAMAREKLSLHLYGMLDDGEAIPKPSDPAGIAAQARAFAAPVEGRPAMVRDEIRKRQHRHS